MSQPLSHRALRNTLLAALPALLLLATAADWPETRRDEVVETLHGVSVADPYRWLEPGSDPEVVAWMRAQDDRTRALLQQVPEREALKQRLAQLLYVESISPPEQKNGRYFYKRTHADKEKAVVYYRDGERGEERVLFDPNRLNPDGNLSLRGWMPSHDGRYVAYKLSKNNADAAIMYVRDLESGEDLAKDVIEGAKYAWASWTPDADGFYYIRLPTDPSIPIAELPGHADVRYHSLGSDPKLDQIIQPALGDPTQFLGADLSRDGRWLFLVVRHGWTRTDVFVRDLKSKRKIEVPETATSIEPTFQPLVVGQNALYYFTAWKGKFYVQTNEGAARYRVFKVDPQRPERASWREIVPERPDATLEKMHLVGNHLVLVYLRNAVNEMEVRNLEGKLVHQVELPEIGTISGLAGNPDDDEAYFSFTSFTQMPQIYRTSVKSGKATVWETIEYPADLSGMTTEQVWYRSKDGTQVSMFLVHRKDWVKNGDNPVLLSGYGGFNSSVTPSFSPAKVVWLEHGGVLATPNLRGGGEYGEEWHRAGMLSRKQNVFDDFVAAAEYLIAEKITRPERLAIRGGSNGGLLVGAAMVQRPELFRAVVCSAPLLDMVRYHRFGSGKTWIEEYGSADDSEQFKFIHAYSPYHHVRKGTAYPALLVLSPDSDDRVDPMHARKFFAAVQWATSSNHPVLLRVEKQSGHGGADLIRQSVEMEADGYAFLFNQLGMN
jgi:prolyl oligopeptidase